MQLNKCTFFLLFLLNFSGQSPLREAQSAPVRSRRSTKSVTKYSSRSWGFSKFTLFRLEISDSASKLFMLRSSKSGLSFVSHFIRSFFMGLRYLICFLIVTNYAALAKSLASGERARRDVKPQLYGLCARPLVRL